LRSILHARRRRPLVFAVGKTLFDRHRAVKVDVGGEGTGIERVGIATEIVPAGGIGDGEGRWCVARIGEHGQTQGSAAKLRVVACTNEVSHVREGEVLPLQAIVQPHEAAAFPPLM
jgi:hypothetical protein